MAQQVFDQTPFSEHVANGATAEFAFAFQVLDADDLVVYLDGVVSPSSDYTVAGVGATSGGSVTFSTLPAEDTVVLLSREIALQRLTEYQTLGDFKAVVVNPDFNRLWMALQGQRSLIDGALRLPYPEQANSIPSADARALRLLGFDSNGDPVALAGAAGDSATALALDLLNGISTKGTALVMHLAAGVGAVARLLRAKLGDSLSVMDFGATADAVTDDTVAIQKAIDAAQLARCELYFPPPAVPGNYYKVTAPLTVTGPIRIRGATPHGVTLYAPSGTLTAGQYIIDINCLSASNVEHSTIEGITVRSQDGVPNGIRINNSSYVRIIDVRTFGVANGLDIEGARCFSNKFDGLVCYGTSGTSVRFLPGFTGGGQFSFKDCTFTGAYGVTVDSTAVTDGLTFDGCNWEGCTTRAVRVQGTVQGLNLEGVRGEGGSGSGFEFAPVSGKEVLGLSITGMSFYSGTVASVPIILGTSGGSGGRVRGFLISGNRVGYAAQNYFVELNAEAQSGVISGNHFSETTTKAVSGRRLGVFVFGNENGGGRLPDVSYDTLAAITYSASMTPDAQGGSSQTITATNNTAFTINAPSNQPPGGASQRLKITLRNTSGGALGTATWNAVFKMATWTNPANGFSRSIEFEWNGTNWVEMSRTTADVPN